MNFGFIGNFSHVSNITSYIDKQVDNSTLYIKCLNLWDASKFEENHKICSTVMLAVISDMLVRMIQPTLSDSSAGAISFAGFHDSSLELLNVIIM